MESLIKWRVPEFLPEARFAFSRPGFVTFKTETQATDARIGKLVNLLGVRSFGRSLSGMVAKDPVDWKEYLLPVVEPKGEGVPVSDPVAQLENAASPTDAGIESEEVLESALTLPQDSAPSRKRKGKNKSLRLSPYQFRILGENERFLVDLPTTGPLLDRCIETLENSDLPLCESLHFWVRDGLLPSGQFRTDQSLSDRVPAMEQLTSGVLDRLKSSRLLSDKATCNHVVAKGTIVLDIVMIEPDHWWIGWHVAAEKVQTWVGGVMPILPTSQPPISRAYYKVREAFAWSELPILEGQHCAEIGAAPGGSCQWLLEQGVRVVGIDPAEIMPPVIDHPNFKHIQRRGKQVRRADIAGIHWLLSDANIYPDLVLDTIEDLLHHSAVKPRGLILTMKPESIDEFANVDRWLNRVKVFGFDKIQTRQLIFNRQEFCVVAQRAKR